MFQKYYSISMNKARFESGTRLKNVTSTGILVCIKDTCIRQSVCLKAVCA